MATDTKNTNQAAAGAGPSAEDQAKGKRKKLLIIIVSVVVLLGFSVGMTLTVLNMFSEKEKPAEGEEVAATVDKKPAIYYALKPAFVVNFQYKTRTRYLQADLTLLIRDPEISLALDTHMPLIRNNLVLLLSNQDFELLQTPEGKESLREQALVKVQEVLQEEVGKPGVEQVLFTSFVMQ